MVQTENTGGQASLREEWKSDYQDFIEATRQFYKKEIDAKTYKGISGGFGSYAQRGGEASMLRLRLPGGSIDKERLAFIADSVKRYHIDCVHFTTCQTVQLHNLSEATVCALAVEALDHGIVTRGGGGDFPRNVMVSPLSGLERGEYFDVRPYALAVSDYLLGFIRGPKMPRKLKVGFSNSPANVTHATFRDLGFVARPDGAFDVYSAGGLGNQPKFGVKVAEKVAPDQVLYHVRAMYELFLAYGNYENRAKARTRYMQETLGGPDNYRKAYEKQLEEVYASGVDLTVCVDMPAVEKAPDGEIPADRRILAQKQPGLCAVKYHPIGGMPKPEFFDAIYQVIKDMDQVELRLSPDEAVYIVNCTGREAERVLEATRDGSKNLFEESVACIGASICQQGVQDSQDLLSSLVEMERREGFSDGILPKIHISGCPSSCGTHQIGVLGFHGCVKVIEKVPVPAFTLHYNGCELLDREQMGEKLGVMLAEMVPIFLKILGQAITGRYESFEQWNQENPDGLKKIAFSFIV